jgi:hypothetical protein
MDQRWLYVASVDLDYNRQASARSGNSTFVGHAYLMLSKRTKSHLAARLGRFVQQYGRKATKGWDPNDRSYDRKLEEKIKRLSPEDLSDLLSGEDVEPVQPHSAPRKEIEN